LKGKTILVIDDEPQLCDLVVVVFEKEGARVVSAVTASEGLDLFNSLNPDLVILDILLPEQDGIEVCRTIRRRSSVPIILLTALSQANDVVRGLDAGADDYVTKPFDRDILVARARAVLRRIDSKPDQVGQDVYDDGYLMVDLERRQIAVDGEAVQLSATEYDVLRYLMQKTGRVCTFAEILEDVWGTEYRYSDEYVHVYIWHLRRKLEKDPKDPRYLISEHSIGYRFTGEQDQV
jgi:two-component system KDP operon response regulator KdpE